jgi:non-heme chloroperoxidase
MFTIFVMLLIVLIAAIFIVVAIALFLTIKTKTPSAPTEKDLFGFAQFKPDTEGLPALQQFQARDGDWLSYRFYESSANQVLILLHGSSSHGEYLHSFAKFLSQNSICKVYVPNLRGHYLSGRRRGDCEYISQLEDDIADLIQLYAKDTPNIFLAGHSSGAGLAIRFAGGKHGELIKGFLLLSPTILNSPSLRQKSAGGWANLYEERNKGLVLLNACGITGLNALPVVEFNKPPSTWDGKETLAYSYRLNCSYHPRIPYKNDIRALKGRFLVLAGSDDKANDPTKYAEVLNDPTLESIKILEGVNHLKIVESKEMMNLAKNWILTHT